MNNHRDAKLAISSGRQRLRERVALVMGAGSVAPGWGNGKAAAVAYAREGAVVACADRNLEAAEETARIIREEGGKAVALRCNVSDEAAIMAAVDNTLTEFGPIGILHNNVGTFSPGGVLHEPAADFSRIIDINLRGAFLSMKHVLPVMVEYRGGVITNVASVMAVHLVKAKYASYYASKAGLCHLSRSVATEYAPQLVRINCILPGFMDTPTVNHATAMAKTYGDGDAEAMRRQRNAMVPMGFMGSAWDVAWAAVFLASDEARYITGINLPVDGGMTAS